jgi:hypothetical protein
MTTDGAPNERAAAGLLVNEENTLYCSAHLIQVAINDQFDEKKANPPPALATHRVVLRKAHDLVVHINGHRATFQVFSTLAKQKRAIEEGARNFDALIVDVVTRWDSELALLERLVYFDTEILEMYGMPDLGLEPEMILNRFEFDLAFGMTLVLTPIRIFTKFVQYRDKPTLGYVPGYIDRLLTQLAPGSFAARLIGRSDGVLAHVEAFQAHLVASIKEKFLPFFQSDHLAMEARLILPGPNLFVFENFDGIDDAFMQRVKARLIDDLVELLPPDTPEEDKEDTRLGATGILPGALRKLGRLPEDADPLLWWPEQTQLGALFPVVMMLLAIPASTAEDERTFSSAGVTLSQRRTRLELDNFRREHRIRHFLSSSTSLNTQAGRQLRIDRANTLLGGFTSVAADRAARAAAPPAAGAGAAAPLGGGAGAAAPPEAGDPMDIDG